MTMAKTTLKALALAAAQERSANALTEAWGEMWEAKERAGLEYEEDAKPEGKFVYTINATITLQPMGAKGMNVSCKAKWSESHSCEPPSTNVNDQPKLNL